LFSLFVIASPAGLPSLYQLAFHAAPVAVSFFHREIESQQFAQPIELGKVVAQEIRIARPVGACARRERCAHALSVPDRRRDRSARFDACDLIGELYRHLPPPF
jgi:hypothetical protein